MRVHGVWSGDGLAFWAETTDTFQRPDTGTRGGPPGRGGGGGRGAGVRPHPYAPAATVVAAALGLDNQPSRTLELLLPGSVKEPLSSPETGRPTEVTRPRLRLWQVPAVVPPAATALRILDEHAGTATLRHWAAVAAFARDLVRRGRVIPRLVAAHGTARAVWWPVVTGVDAGYFRELALAMPPACRTSRTERPSTDVLREALETFTDALVRRALTQPLPEPITGPVAEPVAGTVAETVSARRRTPRERWLAALTGDDPACPDVPELRRELEQWYDAVTTAEGAARVCFRLIEPASPDDDAGFTADAANDDSAHDKTDHSAGDGTGGTGRGWRLELALQAADDPSL
ncbi:hypothetical protein E1267_25530, partial [Nonomuraea longispora]